jgi:uncharacterized membrane protein HdeD (DUF308 family)
MTAIIITIVTLTYPGISIKTTIRLDSIVILIIGIERIAIGIALPLPGKLFKLANIGLGPLIIALAIVLISIPLSHPVSPIALGALALLFNGVSRIIQGIREKEIQCWSRGILIGVGIINIVVSVLSLTIQNFGDSPLARSVSITLLITGIQMLSAPLDTKRKQNKPHASMI